MAKKDELKKEIHHVYIHTEIRDFSFIKAEISGPREVISQIDRAIHKVLDDAGYYDSS